MNIFIVGAIIEIIIGVMVVVIGLLTLIMILCKKDNA